MIGLIALSEVARNLTLPAVAVLGVVIAFWQARMTKRKNGFDAVSKAADLHVSDSVSKRLASYALLLEAIDNSESRRMASSVFWTYLWMEKEEQVLRDCLRLAAGIEPSVKGWIEWRLDVVVRERTGDVNV